MALYVIQTPLSHPHSKISGSATEQLSSLEFLARSEWQSEWKMDSIIIHTLMCYSILSCTHNWLKWAKVIINFSTLVIQLTVTALRFPVLHRL